MADELEPGWSNSDPLPEGDPPGTVEPYAEPTPGWSNSAPLPPAPEQPDPITTPPPPGFSNRVPATGASAGAPGTWTPSGAQPAANLAGLSGVTASPATAWTTGQYVELRDWSYAHWNGTAWTAGKKP